MTEHKFPEPMGFTGPGAKQLAQMFRRIYEKRAREYGSPSILDPSNNLVLTRVCDDILEWFDLKVTADEIARLQGELEKPCKGCGQ